MPMLLVAPLKAMQPFSSWGRGPCGAPLQSVASKAAMEPAPRSARASRIEVWLAGRARAPALRARRRNVVENCIVRCVFGSCVWSS